MHKHDETELLAIWSRPHAPENPETPTNTLKNPPESQEQPGAARQRQECSQSSDRVIVSKAMVD